MGDRIREAGTGKVYEIEDEVSDDVASGPLNKSPRVGGLMRLDQGVYYRTTRFADGRWAEAFSFTYKPKVATLTSDQQWIVKHYVAKSMAPPKVYFELYALDDAAGSKASSHEIARRRLEAFKLDLILAGVWASKAFATQHKVLGEELGPAYNLDQNGVPAKIAPSDRTVVAFIWSDYNFSRYFWADQAIVKYGRTW